MVNYGMLMFNRLLAQSLTFISRFGQDSFQEALKISQRMNKDLMNWSNFKFMVFDIPNHTGTYKERYSELGT